MNVALIGLGRWGPRLVPKLLDHRVVDGIYCFDIDRTRMDKVVQEFPTLKVTSDYESILSNQKIDALIIATPAASHYSLARRALEHGKHVLVEKPLSNKVAQAQHLIELASAQDLRLMVDHITVYSGMVRAIKKLIDSKDMGRLLYIDSVRAGLGMLQLDVSVVWDLAVHEFAVVDYLLDEKPSAVSATGSAFYGALEEIAYATLFFQSGLAAHVHVSWLSPVRIRKLMISGMKKMLVFDDTLSDDKITLFDRGVDDSRSAGVDEPAFAYRDGVCQVLPYGRTEPMVALIDEFMRSIDEGRAPLTNGTEGLRIVKILEAVEESIKKQGMRVKLV
jgi:predicted dehydrogenase